MSTKRFKSLTTSHRAEELRDEYREAYATYAEACEAHRRANNEAVALGDASSRALCALKVAAGKGRRATMREATPEAWDAWEQARRASAAADAANADARRLCEGLRYRARRLCAAAFAQIVADNSAFLDGQAAHYKSVGAFCAACREFIGEGAQIYIDGPRYSFDSPHCEAGVFEAGVSGYGSDSARVRFDLGTDSAGLFDVEASPSFPDAGGVPTVDDVRRAVETARTARDEARKAAEAYRHACDALEASVWPLASVVADVRRAESVQR